MSVEIDKRTLLKYLIALGLTGGSGVVAGCARQERLPEQFPVLTSQKPSEVAPALSRPEIEFEPAIHELIPNIPATNFRRPVIFFSESLPPAEKIPAKILGEVPYFCQADPDFQDANRCAIKNACGRTVAAMLLAYYGKIPNTEEAAYSVVNAWCGGTSANQLRELTGQYGLQLDFIGGKKEDGTLYDPFFTKERLIELVGQSPVALTIPGHWTLVVGYQDESFVLNEPYPPKWGVAGCEGKGILVPEDTLWQKYVSTTWRALYVTES